MRRRMSVTGALEDLRSVEPHTSARALRFLMRKGDLSALVSAMAEPNVLVRSGAAMVLGQLRKGHDVLIDHLTSDPSSHVRRTCALALGLDAYPPAVAAFIAALHDDDEGIVKVTCSYLGTSGDERAIQPLRGLTEHGSWEVRFKACRALYRLGAIDDALIGVMEAVDRDPKAVPHNDWVLQFRESERELGYDPQQWSITTSELLQAARAAQREHEPPAGG